MEITIWYSSHPLGKLKLKKKDTMTSFGKDVEKLEPSFTVGSSLKFFNTEREKKDIYIQRPKVRLTVDLL